MTTNMAILTEHTKSHVYPMRARATTAPRQIAAAHRARLHALGLWAGGNDPAARGRLRLLPWLLLPSRAPQAAHRRRRQIGQVDREPTASAQRVCGGADASGRGSGRS